MYVREDVDIGLAMLPPGDHEVVDDDVGKLDAAHLAIVRPKYYTICSEYYIYISRYAIIEITHHHISPPRIIKHTVDSYSVIKL
jgi:hypothetical protein